MKKRKKRAFYAAWVTTVLCGTALLLGITKGTKTRAASGTLITGGMTITEAGDYYLGSDVTGNLVISSDIDVKLDLNGYVLSGTGSGSVIKVSGGGKLTIKDSRPETLHTEPEYVYSTGGIITGGNTDFGGGVQVIGSTLILDSGTITGNRALYGAGIYVGSEGLVQINGGAVTRNLATIPESSGSTPLGGGLYANNSHVQMSGGEVSINTVENRDDSTGSSYGGGMYIIGNLEMTGGEIKNNTVSNNASGKNAYAGGVYVKGEFILSGGSVANNQLYGTATDSHCNGAGVYLQSGSMVMSDGYISGNKAHAQKDSLEFGGGIYCNGGSFTISGGMIAENDAGNGGGIYNCASVLMSGGSVLRNTANYGGGIYNYSSLEITAGDVLLNFSLYGGGGVYNTGSFHMKGGTLSYNHSLKNGGGAWVKGESVLLGGRILKNTAEKGGGVYVEEKTTAGGTIRITDNVSDGMIYDNEDGYSLSGGTTQNLYLPENTVFAVGTGDDAPADGMRVGITTQTKPTQDDRVAVSEEDTTDCHSYFFADGAMKEDVLYNSDDFLLYLAVPVIRVTQNGENPVYKTALDEDEFFTVSCEGFGDAPTCKLEWKYVDEDGTVWKEDAPEATLTITEEGDVTTTAATPAGSYSFRITNGQPELVENQGSTTTPKEKMANPLFVSSGEMVFTVGKLEQTITADSLQNVSYKDSDKAVAASAVGTLSFSVKSGNSVTVDSSDGSLTILDLGDTVITIEAAATDNYLAATMDITVRVGKKEISKPTENTGIFTYTGTEQTYLPVGYDASVMQIEGNTKTAANPTGYTVTVTPKYGYEWSTEGDCSFVWVIEKAALKAIASSHTVAYGAAIPEYTVSYTGFKNGQETPTTEPVLTSVYTAESATGQYEVTFFTAPVFANYAVTTVNGVITVNRAACAIEPTANNPTYNGEIQSGVLQNGTYVVLGGISTATNAGSYQFTATPDSNHAWADGSVETKTYDWNIAKAPLVVTAKAKSIGFKDAGANNGVEYSGFVNGETEAVLIGTLTYSYLTTGATPEPYRAGDPLGTYRIVPGGLTADNYEITFQNGTLTVGEKKIDKPQAVNKTYIYSGTEQTIELTGFDAETMNIAPEGKKTAAGTYIVRITPKDGFGWNTEGNCSLEWTIGKAALTAIASSHTVEYGTAVPVYTVSYTGFKNGQELPTTEPVLSSVYTAESVPGQYEVTFSTVPEFANYAVTTENGVVTVNRAACATEPTATDFTYDKEEHLGVLLNGTFVVLGGVSSATNAGSYQFTATPDSNHAWADGSVETKTYDWKIAKATVEAPALEGRVYTGETLTAIIDDTDKLYRVTKNEGGIDAGTYDVELTLRDAANYQWMDSDAETKTIAFAVLKAENAWLTEPSVESVTFGTAISPNGSAKYGEFTVSYNGIDGTDYSGDTTPHDAGKYEAVFKVEETGNYKELSRTVEFTIAKKSIDGATVVYEEAKAYNGQLQYFSVSSVTIDGVSSTFSVADNTARDCAETDCQMTITGTGNFEGSIVKPFRITKAKVTKPEADSTVFVYNGNSRQYYLPGNDRYIITGNYQRNAGTYQVVVTLKDKNNCEWQDGSDSNLYYSFVIAKASNAIYNLTVGTGTDCPEPPSATADFGTVQFVYATAENRIFDIVSMPTEPGEYVVRAYVEGNDNYESAFSEKEFTITESEDPTGDDPTGDDPTGDDPTGDDPTGEDPTGEDPTGEDPTGEDPTGDDPTGDDPTGDDPTGEDPTGDDPTGDDPTGEDPTGDDPTGEDPTGDDPTGDDPAEEDPTGKGHGKNPSKEKDTKRDSTDDEKTEITQEYDPKLAPIEDLTLEVKLDEEAMKTCKSLLERFEKIGDVYDVRLMKNGQEIQPQDLGDGMTVVVRIPVPKKLVGRKFRLVHMHSADDIGMIVEGSEPGVGTFVIDKDGYIVTKVDRLSKFVYLYQPKCYLHWAALALLGAYAIAYVLFCLLGEDKVKLLITAILLEIAEALIVFFAGCVYCYIVAAAAFVCIGVCTVRRLKKMLCH